VVNNPQYITINQFYLFDLWFDRPINSYTQEIQEYGKKVKGNIYKVKIYK